MMLSPEPFITVKQKLSKAHVVGKCDLLKEITVMTQALWLPQASEVLIVGEKCKPDVLACNFMSESEKVGVQSSL